MTTPLESLKDLLEEASASSGKRRRFYSRELESAGTVLRSGALCEVTGSARTQWMVSFLKQNPDVLTFWVEPHWTLLPTALQQQGLGLSRVLMAEAGDLYYTVLRRALRSGLFQCVVLPQTVDDVGLLKALQLFAREAGACVFFLTPQLQNSWVVSLQLQAQWSQNLGAKEFETTVVKAKISEGLRRGVS